MFRRMIMMTIVLLACLWGSGVGLCEDPADEKQASGVQTTTGVSAPSERIDETTEEESGRIADDQTDEQMEAQTTEPVRFNSTEALIDLMTSKGVISEEEAAAFIQQYREATSKTGVITVIPGEQGEDYLREITKDLSADLQEEVDRVKKDLDDTTEDLLMRSRLAKKHRDELELELREDIDKQLRKSGWAQRFRWGGDIRLRYQGDYFDDDNADLLKPDDPNELMNTKEDRHRGRIRVRLNAKATVFESDLINIGKMEAGVRIASGNENDPVSTNETLGDYSNKDTILLDRAYLKWRYKPEDTIWGHIPQVDLMAGRFSNPYFSTDLVWDSDLGFEGAAFSFKSDTRDEFIPWAGFLTVGGYLLQEEEFFQKDKYFYGAQAGVVYEEPFGLNAQLGVAFYQYKHTGGRVNDPTQPGLYNWTAPEFQQKGNTIIDIDPGAAIKTALVADYEELVVTGKLDYAYSYPVRIILTGDYVKNIGFDREAVALQTGLDVSEVEEAIEGYRIGLSVGNPQVRWFGEWNLYAYYKYLESDAVIDAFTDSDFHLGGTNAKGWVLGVDYGLHKDIWLSAKWITSDEIDGPPLSVDTLQMDVNARY